MTVTASATPFLLEKGVCPESGVESFTMRSEQADNRPAAGSSKTRDKATGDKAIVYVWDNRSRNNKRCSPKEIAADDAKCGTVVQQQVDIFVQFGWADTLGWDCVVLPRSRGSATRRNFSECPSRGCRQNGLEVL